MTGFLPRGITQHLVLCCRIASVTSAYSIFQLLQKKSSLAQTCSSCAHSPRYKFNKSERSFHGTENLNPHYENTWLLVGCQLVTSTCLRGPMTTEVYDPCPLNTPEGGTSYNPSASSDEKWREGRSATFLPLLKATVRVHLSEVCKQFQVTVCLHCWSAGKECAHSAKL